MKKGLAIFLSVLLVFISVPAARTYAEEDVVLTVTADRETAAAGDTVEFIVLLGAVSDLGALQFNLAIPEGLSFVEGSAVLPDGDTQDALNSDGDIALPKAANRYTWAYSAKTPGYAGNSALGILKFSCTVNADAEDGEKKVSLDIDGCYNFSDIEELQVKVVPVTVTIGAAEPEPTVTPTLIPTPTPTINPTPTVDPTPTLTPTPTPTPAPTITPMPTVTPTPTSTPVHTHTGIVMHPAVAATCIAAGNVEYWTCSGEECAGKYYSDAECQRELRDITVPVDSDRHVGGEAWKSNAERHFHVCACGALLDESAHEYDNDTDISCNVCGYQRFYIVTEGAGAVYEQGLGGGLRFAVEGDFDLFISVKVDGSELGAENYSASRGSTVIELKEGYLNALAVGSHELTVLFSDGKTATTVFVIVQPAPTPTPVPETTPTPAPAIQDTGNDS